MFKDYKNVYSYTWTIENFSFCHHRTGVSLHCSFIDKNVSGRLWRLELYPRGREEENSAFISVSLQIFNSNRTHLVESYFQENVECGFKIEIIGASGNKLKSSGQEINVSNADYFCSKFLEIKKVIEDAEDSQNDILTVRCYVYGNNSGKQAFEGDVWRTKMLVDRLYCSWDKNIFIEEILQENLVFPNKVEFKIVLTLTGNVLQIKITKVNSKSFTDYFVKCKIALLACDVYDDVILRNTVNLCTEKATYFFKSKSFSRPETWEFPSDIISNKLKEHNALAVSNKASFSYRIICELLCSHGLEEVLPLIASDKNTAAAKMYPTLQEDLHGMFLSKKYCDVKLKVGNQIVEAHKNILTARSPVFSTMFDQNMIEANTGYVEIIDIELNTLYLFLEFLYTDTVNKMDYGEAKSLIIVADKYEVLSLKELCADLLNSELSVRNVCEILVIADMVRDATLKSESMKFIKDNEKEVLSSQDWKSWEKGHIELVAEVCDKLKTESSRITKTVCVTNDLQEKRRRID